MLCVQAFVCFALIWLFISQPFIQFLNIVCSGDIRPKEFRSAALKQLEPKLLCSLTVKFPIRHSHRVGDLFLLWNDTKRNITNYYPTLLRRVQITRETSTNITRYLYSSHSSWPCDRLKNLASQNFGTRNLWIVNHLLDILVCSITVYFYSLFVFWLALRARQSKAQLVKVNSDTTHQNI